MSRNSALALLAGSLAVSMAARTADALPFSATDLWQGATVTASTGAHSDSDLRDMFGGAFASSEPGNAVFRDGAPAGTVHAVEWQTGGAVTIRSFILNAAHDGTPRDALYRGFSTFNLFAFNNVTSAFELVFTFNPANPYDNSVAPVNGVIDHIGYNLLSLGVNIAPVTTNRFRAEFVQFGFVDPSASGPRIQELDGFDTFLTQATIPTTAVPEPATFGAFSSALLTLALALRRVRRRA